MQKSQVSLLEFLKKVQLTSFKFFKKVSGKSIGILEKGTANLF